MKTAYIGIGSNLGDKEGHCLRAMDRLGRIPECGIIVRSDWYLTRPVGVEGQDWYVNGVASLGSEIPAEDLLYHLLLIEKEMGRVRTQRWASRIIDLDILLFGEEVINKEDLKIPHPLMHLRRFVLVPMAQIAPDLIHPSFGMSMEELLKRLPEDGQEVIPVKE
jgi:2-amino-4-hydroxy-6-hydroxymethyldihydropteridine diphosphokinase